LALTKSQGKREIRSCETQSSGSVSTAANAAIRQSIASDVTYVVAAENHDDDAANYSPSSIVGGTTMSDHRQRESNFRPLLHLFASGEEIASSSRHDDSALDISSGTSLAAPHAAGIAARYLEVHPDASPPQNALIRVATRGRLIDAGPGSPNKLLTRARAR
jgi:subtilisin family serine protease